MRKKLLSFILSMVMVFSLVPASAFAATDFEPPNDGYELAWSEDFEDYDLWVSGVRVTSANAGDVLEDGTVSNQIH